MLKKINPESLHDDLRKVGITFFIAGLTGLFLGPPHEAISLSLLMVLGSIFWVSWHQRWKE